MSDAENDATLDHRRVSDAAPGQRITPHPQPTLGAAPWERFSEPPSDYNLHRWQAEAPIETRPEFHPDRPLEPVEPRTASTEKTGCHTDGGVTVADLIAKFGAPALDRPSHHRVAQHVAPDTESSEAAPDLPVDQQDTQVIEALPYSLEAVSELPDLDAANYPQDDGSESEQTTGTPTASRRVLPRRIRRTSAPEAPNIREPKTKSRRRPILLAARSLAALFAALALALTGGAWQWSTSKNNRLNTISALDPHSGDILDPNGQYGDEDFLIVGMDSRSGENANMGAGDTEDAGGARSDTVMLVNIPANRKRVVAVSFPRDLAITPIQCEAWNPDTGKYGPIYDQKKGTWGSRMVYTETKLNSTFSYGGPKCLVKEIQKLSGLSINRFIAVDFAGFARMVEALGGVEVCSSTALHDYELGTVLQHAGRQVIDGPTALNYVRARQVTTETNGDYGRIKRQQRFLSSLLRSLISEDMLFDLNKLNNVVNMFISDSYVDNVKTKDLVQLGQSLQGISAGHITFVTVPTGITDQNGDEPPRMADMRALFDAIINDDPLPEENDQNAKPLGGPPQPRGRRTRPPPRRRRHPLRAPKLDANRSRRPRRAMSRCGYRTRPRTVVWRPARPASSSGTAST